MKHRAKLRTRVLAGVLACALAGPAHTQSLPELGDPAQAELSPQLERKIGESLMREMRWHEADYLDDPEIEDYLNQLGNRLVAASPGARDDFHFFAIKNPTLNAYAWPGGFIGVHTGLILAAENESELASVLSHEISHVTQRHIVRLYATQSTTSAVALAGLLIAILAAKNNSQVSEAAIASTQAAGIQSQLNYTREFEREADRIGIQTLAGAGFDVRGMASFFERLQKANRLYDNNAPAYLRTHPLTTERIADIEARIAGQRYKQTPDSLDFQLVRAKLRAQRGTPADAVADFSLLVQEKRGPELPARYGLVRAWLRAGDPAKAQAELASLMQKQPDGAPLIESLAAEILHSRGDTASAVARYKTALGRYANSRALQYGHLDSLISSGAGVEAARLGVELAKTRSDDVALYTLIARAYASSGKRTNQHRYTAEAYALKGNLIEAIEQLELARKANDGDFFDASMVDARLREFKKRRQDELKDKKPR